MTKEQEAEKAWKKEAGKFWMEYFKTDPISAKCNEMTIDCMSKFVDAFKSALKAEIEKERDYCKELLDAGFADSQSEDRCYAKFEFCNTLLNRLIDETKPLE